MQISIKSIETITDAQEIEDIFNPEAYDGESHLVIDIEKNFDMYDHERHIILDIDPNPLWMIPDYFDVVMNVKDFKDVSFDISLTCSKTRSPTPESRTNLVYARQIRFHSIRGFPFDIIDNNPDYERFIDELKNKVKTLFC